MSADSRDVGNIQPAKSAVEQLSDQVQQLTGMNQELMQLLLKLDERVTNVEQVLKTGTWSQ